MVFQTFKYLFTPTMSAAPNESNGQNPMLSNRSMLKDFLASIATMTGDLSNITAPPFVLDTKSVVEIPAYWAENPSLFVSPALSDDPLERSLRILKSFLCGMKSQCYMGHSEEEGVKKPLNAFLGEIFKGHWEDEELGTTYMVSEQVSHHPPITACRVWNPKVGVVAEGYNRQKITFSMGSVRITSSGFALKTLEKYNESYLLPLPDFRVKGVLSGAPYPETAGDWYIPSTNGYISKITFSGGKGFLGGGTKHGFTASLYKEGDESNPFYTISGCWNGEFTIRDERKGEDIETIDIRQQLKKLPELKLPTLEEMDPWESRRAWADTCEAIRRGDFKGTSQAKGYLEQGQRDMRKEEEKNGAEWRQVFFKNHNSHDVAKSLMAKVPGPNFDKVVENTNGIWLFDPEAFKTAEPPYHPGVAPDNVKDGQQRRYSRFQTNSRESLSSNQSRSSVDLGHAGVNGNTGSRTSVDSAQFNDSDMELDQKVGAKDDGRSVDVDGVLIDVGQQPKKETEKVSRDQPEPQTHQLRHKEEDLGTGIEDLSLREKIAVEEMLRDKYTSGS